MAKNEITFLASTFTEEGGGKRIIHFQVGTLDSPLLFSWRSDFQMQAEIWKLGTASSNFALGKYCAPFFGSFLSLMARRRRSGRGCFRLRITVVTCRHLRIFGHQKCVGMLTLFAFAPWNSFSFHIVILMYFFLLRYTYSNYILSLYFPNSVHVEYYNW